MTSTAVPPVEAEPRTPPSPLATSLRVLVVGTLVAVPLVFDPRQGHAGGRPKYLLLVAAAVVAGVLLAGEMATGHRRRRPSNWLRVPVLGLVAWTAVSAVVSDHPDTVLSGFPGSYDGLFTAVSLAVLFGGTVAALRPADVRAALTVLWFVAGGAVLTFGLVQLTDRLLFPEGWDWARPSISPWTIGSTLGNPNHLASFLVVLLPVGVVLWALAERRAQRTAVAGMGVLLVVELGITSSRGGLVAAVAGMAVLAVLLRREVARHRSLALRAAAGVVALGLVAAAVFEVAGATKRDLGSLARAGTGSTVDLRREVWASAWRVAIDHPVVGVGPDVFPVVFPEYATERFMLLFGPFTIANGAHNVFLNTLANQGGVGLVLFLVVLGTAAVGIRRQWRAMSGRAEREHRLLLAGVSAALVAFLVQASFNAQEVALSLMFWSLLGMAVVLSPRHRIHLAKEEP